MKKKITIGHLPIIDHLVLGVAKENDGGNFKDFTLATKRYVNWEKMMADLTTKKLDGAFLLFPLALELFHEKFAGKIVLLGQREGQAIIAKKSIANIAGLKGKTILLPHHFSVHHLLAHELLERAGLDPEHDIIYKTGFKDVHEIPQALADGTVDAFVSAEPWNTIALQSGAGHIIGSSEEFKAHHVCCVLVLRDDLVKNNASACAELIASLVRAGMFVNAYPRQSAEIAESFIDCPKDIALKALTRNRGSVMFWDLLPRLDDFESLQNLAVDRMNLWKRKLDLRKFMDTRFAEVAYRAWTIHERKTVKDRGSARTLPGSALDAVLRLEHAFGMKIPAAAMRIVQAGEKYPHAQNLREGKSITAGTLDAAADGASYRIPCSEPCAKAITLSRIDANAVAGFVFIKLTKSQLEHIEESVRFGTKNEQKFPRFEIREFASIRGGTGVYAAGNHFWLRIENRYLKMLPLLLAS